MGKFIVIGTVLVGVGNQQCDRHSRCLSLIHAGEYGDGVGFVAFRPKVVAARPSSVQHFLTFPQSMGKPDWMPSITTPMAFPCDSPNVVKVNSYPKLLCPILVSFQTLPHQAAVCCTVGLSGKCSTIWHALPYNAFLRKNRR